MLQLVPIPAWDSIHPLIVHFPIALLIVAPLFVVLALLAPRSSRAFAAAALLLMTIGTAGAVIAVETGEAAAQLADRTPAVNEVLERHQELAELTRNTFLALTVVFAAIVIVPAMLKRRFSRGSVIAAHAVFLVLYLGGLFLLVNTAHNGGRLVHQLGVHSLL